MFSYVIIMAKKEDGKWLLYDLSRHPLRGDMPGDIAKLTISGKPWIGHVVVAGPFEARQRIDFTGPPGSVSGIYYSLTFQLGKWEYQVHKADEWIEVSPVHAQYYQLTQKQKEELEGKIKQGLVSVSQSVADMELLMHDKRRYLEFLHYMGYRTSNELIKDKKNEKREKEEHVHQEEQMNDLCLYEDRADGKEKENLKKEREGRIDNHSLKAVFIDQVDMHTGEGISMRSIVSRWPTLITDFMRANDDDMDPEKVMKKLNVSKAEAVVLITKNKLYQEWKNIFGPEIKSRYVRINELVQAREASVNQYKEWLKPYIARHKLIEEGLSRSGVRSAATTSFITSGGMATSSAQIVLYVWKDFIVPELYKSDAEMTAKMKAFDKLEPDDKWTRKHLIFGKKWGLINNYKWITEDWVEKQKNAMFNDGWLTPHKPYYSFFKITLDKTNIRMPTGEEMEDGVFDVNMFLMSQNAAFCKMLELKARQQEVEDHINKLLGVYNPPEGKRQKYEDDKNNPVKKFFDWFNINMELSKGGPYERDFNDRIAKIYLARCAQERYAPIIDFVKNKCGIPK